MNHFMARLIFCFFAEDTDIFNEKDLFTNTVAQMSESNSSNTHEIVSEIFCAMNTKQEKRKKEGVRNWVDKFPYVNGGLFSGSTEVPVFTKIARSYLLHVGSLDWTQINPDIFGSMIQAVADDEERGSLGMHYTSVPNILKVLNPLFLNDLRHQLEKAGNNGRKLLNLRKRMSNIRVFDPACGSGNFLVIAYKQMREIESEINIRRGEAKRMSDIPLTNFRGIEIRDFPAEIARLALIIAEYQCDLHYRDQKLALAEFLPLDTENWITSGNALKLDWLSICPPTGTSVKMVADDLFETPLEQAEIDFENEGGETYICGNPPYLGGKGQSKEQKDELTIVFDGQKKIGELDYVSGWLVKAAKYALESKSKSAFVCTSSVNQGAQVHQLWPKIYNLGCEIKFADRSFKWSNNAANNAAVICSIIGLGIKSNDEKFLYTDEIVQKVNLIGPYLIPNTEVIVYQSLSPLSNLPKILTGNSPYDGGNLLLSSEDSKSLLEEYPKAKKFVKKIFGSQNFINGEQRYCLWIKDEELSLANQIPPILERIGKVKESRESGGEVAKTLAKSPHKFRYTHQAKQLSIIIPRVSSERREYIPFGVLDNNCIISDSAQAVYDPELWVISILLSKMHMSWVKIISGKLKNDIRYSSALCYNTFPIPKLTEKNIKDLTNSAEALLLARESHFPDTLAELYDPENMPEDLRRAHERNDEVLERIYIGRRFKNDTERLEKLFDLYTQMTSKSSSEKEKVVN